MQSSANLKLYYATCFSLIAGIIIFGGLLAPTVSYHPIWIIIISNASYFFQVGCLQIMGIESGKNFYEISFGSC